MKKTLIFGIILLLSLAAANAATVSHSASQIKQGSFQAGSYDFPGVLTVGSALFVNASSGNVGIGTASPGGLLQVGRAGQSDNVILGVNDGVTNTHLLVGGDIELRSDYTTGNRQLKIYNAGGNQVFNFPANGVDGGGTWLNAGNVGIGTTSPDTAYTGESPSAVKLRIGKGSSAFQDESGQGLLQVQGYSPTTNGIVGTVEFLDHRQRDAIARITAIRDGSTIGTGALRFFTNDGI